MAIIKCKMCGGDLALTPGQSVAECEYCGSRQTVPAADDDKKLSLFARANRLRAACDFDKASGIYETIVADFPEEAEAYWGLVLCKFGIEYVDDPTTGKKVPTCHRSSFESVMEDSDFDQALENADQDARKIYRDEAKVIEDIRKRIIEISSKEEPYDIFICYKETDTNGERTIDSVLAQDIYDALTDKGYRVFFSRITLEDKLGQEYEPYIFAALSSAKVMLAVGTDYEYYNAIWVKNEWSRYLKLMEKDKEKHLIPCYKGIDAYDMPKEFVRLQAQDLGKMGAIQDIQRNMEKYVPLKKASVNHTTDGSTELSDKIAELLEKGQKAMASKQWESANSLFDQVLAVSAESPSRFLIEQSVRQSKEQVQFQLRRKKCRKYNWILTAILALLMILPSISAGREIVGIFETNELTSDVPDIGSIVQGVHTAFCGFVILFTLLASRFVGKSQGAKTGWTSASRVFAVIGMLITAGFYALFYFMMNVDNTFTDYPSITMATGLLQWFKTMFIVHAIAFIGLFFRKKV